MQIRLFALFLLCFPAICSAQFCTSGNRFGNCTTAICNAADTSLASFEAAWPTSSNANATVTINIPSGSSTWSGSTNPICDVPSAVTNILIQGASTVSCTGTAGTSSYSCTPTDNTLISDGMTSNYMMQLTTGASSTVFRMTGISIQGSSGGGSKSGGHIGIYGNSQSVRVDHMHFNIAGYTTPTGNWVRAYGPILGVVDHFVIDQGPNALNNLNGIQSIPSTAFGDSIGNGDGTWASATPWGTNKFLYVENGVFNGGYGNDCDNGGAMVMRYNTFNQMTLPMQNHATKSDGGAERGCRALEFYHNYISAISTGQNAIVGMKGSPALVWGNVVGPGGPGTLSEFWGGSVDRATLAQGEMATPTGWGFVGTTPVATGTATLSAPVAGIYTVTWASGNTFSTTWPIGTNFLLDTPGGVSIGQWSDFAIHATVTSTISMTVTCTNPPISAGCPSSAVTTAVAYGVASNWDGNFKTNGYPALDGIGRGQTVQALNGALFPNRLNSSTGTIAWPQQYLEPVYLWMNTYGSVPVFGTGNSGIQDSITTVNTDIFAENSSFTGANTGTSLTTGGTGFGLLSARPSTCTAGPGGTYYTSPTGSYGVAYWATDANSGNGELYVCTATNMWTGIYQPFTYPHPLDTSGSQAATPTFSPVAGSYSVSQSVAISSATGGVTICYTNDGTLPMANGSGACTHGTTLANGGTVTVLMTQTLKAIASKSGFSDSSIGVAIYTIVIAPAINLSAKVLN